MKGPPTPCCCSTVFSCMLSYSNMARILSLAIQSRLFFVFHSLFSAGAKEVDIFHSWHTHQVLFSCVHAWSFVS